MTQIYNNPKGGQASSIGPQFNVDYWDKRSLIEEREKMFFSPLASSREMPKHFGKELKVYHYVPMLDDRNVNDQGLDAAGATVVDGNLYGSSKDIGKIVSKMPLMRENGGRVNRVGFTRLERRGSLTEYGFFTEFTEDSLTFDSDSELYQHKSREMVNGANEIYEDLLQADLLNAAGSVSFTGAAISDATMTGEGADKSVVDYDTLKRLAILLTDNRTPTTTKMIKGSNLTDTKTINAGRILFIGSELQMTVENMVDGLGRPAFVPIRQYGDAGEIMTGEIGTVGDFRIVVVPNMMFWEGAGAAVGTDEGYSHNGTNYNIYPMLTVGDEAFATVGLQGGANGKGKFSTIMKKPGKETAAYHDPYGKVGFSSITFYHGFIALRPERIGLVKTCAAA